MYQPAGMQGFGTETTISDLKLKPLGKCPDWKLEKGTKMIGEN